MRKKSLVAFAILVLATLPCRADSVRESRTVTKDEAQALVRAALPAKLKRLPKFGMEISQDQNHPRFYYAMVYWAGEPQGSVMVGNYDVDTETGDVWDAVTSCDEMDTRALRRLQKMIRRKISLSDTEYKRVKDKGPLCE
jgi:hypothetical protein